ncbi:MAG: pyridoxamine 5'-phosphate oxidase [Bacteroidota bacterium]
MHTISPEILAIRTNYGKMALDESAVDKNAILQFRNWLQAAVHSQVIEPNAMCLSTIGPDGFPTGRIVLLRGVSEQGFAFFTNYNSHKGHEIEQHPKVSLTFFWPDLERQVRISGTIAKLPAKDSDEYFNSRPRQSQIGAWASAQSEVIGDREELEVKEKEYEAQFEGKEVPRPEHWGGYQVSPIKIEFWQGRASRLHDRLQYTLEHGAWKMERLSP